MRPWRPLLAGDIARRACEAVAAIARDLGSEKGVAAEWGHCLAFGTTGIALFHAYHMTSGAAPGEEGNGRAEAFLDAAIANVAALTPGLFRGYSGVAWVFEHLRDPLYSLAPGEEDPLDVVDAALLRWVEGSDPIRSELFAGLGGICLYTASRWPRRPVAELRSGLLARLAETAQELPDGFAWRLPEELGARFHAEGSRVEGEDLGVSFRRGVYQTTAAHGVAGTLAPLAALVAVRDGYGDGEGASLRDGAAEWLLAQRRDDPLKAFPDFVGSALTQPTSGWCNGDLGVSLALRVTALEAGRDDWLAAAYEVAAVNARKRADDVEWINSRNPNLCHGSLGRAHAFNRLFQETEDEVFAEAAEYWFEEALALRSPGRGIGGFLVDEPLNGGEKSVPGWLMGAAGMGLALLAAITDVEPRWDALLLGSPPAAGN